MGAPHSQRCRPIDLLGSIATSCCPKFFAPDGGDAELAEALYRFGVFVIDCGQVVGGHSGSFRAPVAPWLYPQAAHRLRGFVLRFASLRAVR
jgi:hypothetical protein